MYADDISLIAKSPTCSQAMLDIVFEYARKWRYQLNSIKSLVMVMIESAATRVREQLRHKRKLGNSFVHEADEQHHLGIYDQSLTPLCTEPMKEQHWLEVLSLHRMGLACGSALYIPLHPSSCIVQYVCRSCSMAVKD